MRPTLRLILCLVSCLLLPTWVVGISVSCRVDGCTMVTENAYFEIDAQGSRLYLNDGGSPRKDLASMLLGFNAVTERAKMDYGGNVTFCKVNGNDPIANSTSEGAVGELYAYYNLITSPQTFTYRDHYPYPGVHSVVVTVSLAPSNATLNITYALSETDFDVVLSNDTTHTLGIIPMSRYRQNSLKLSLEMLNYPWATPDTHNPANDTFVTVYLNAAVNAVQGDVITIYHGNETSATVTNSALDYGIQYVIDPFFFVDGVPFFGDTESSQNASQGTINVNFPAGFVWSNPLPLPICKQPFVEHFQNVTYDPTMGVLFSNFGSAPNGKTSASTIAVAAAVPVVFVALAVAVLLILFVKPIYNKVLPSDPFGRNKGALKALANAIDEKDAPPARAAALSSPAPLATSQSIAALPATESWRAASKPSA